MVGRIHIRRPSFACSMEMDATAILDYERVVKSELSSCGKLLWCKVFTCVILDFYASRLLVA
jgi:hypothetical protein